jgi:hypothetical protein
MVGRVVAGQAAALQDRRNAVTKQVAGGGQQWARQNESGGYA